MREQTLISCLAVLLLLAGVLLACVEPLHGADGARRPNIVFFIVDDLGQRDLGCYGSTFYETPHLDRLAGEGARFTDAYAACPVCSPSRAAIITGKYPQRTQITDFIGAAQPEDWKRNTKHLPASYSTHLALEETTLAETLKHAGYATFFGGKWHLGGEPYWPEHQGFDENLGGIDRGGPYGGKRYFSPYGNPRLSDGPPGEHLPARLAAEAARFIEQHRAAPFLVYLPFYSVHTPLMARADLQQKYEAKRKQLPQVDQFGEEAPRRVRLTQDHAVYGGMVEAMDQAVGVVLAKLDALALSHETLVLFTSDNGGLSTSEGSPTSNMPLRAGKGWLYEGGIRVPLIARWPGRISASQVNETPVTGTDFYPTLLEAAGLPARADLQDGRSFLSAVTGGRSASRDPLYWHYPHYGNQGGAPGAAIRDGDWKLIEWFDDDRVELFHLKNDPSEQTNLATAEPERAASLRAKLHVWQEEVGAVATVPNPRYDAEKPTGRGR